MYSEQGRKIRQRLLKALITVGGAVAGVVEEAIYPLVREYAQRETTAGRHLGPEKGHSGSTTQDLKAHRKGGSLLASRIRFWQERLGNRANSFELFKKLSADALILLVELLLRKIRDKMGKSSTGYNSDLETNSQLNKANLLLLLYLSLGILNVKLYSHTYDDEDSERERKYLLSPTRDFLVYDDLESPGNALWVKYQVTTSADIAIPKIEDFFKENRGKIYKVILKGKTWSVRIDNMLNAALVMLCYPAETGLEGNIETSDYDYYNYNYDDEL